MFEEKRVTVGRWRGQLADKINGIVYVRVGVDGSWFRPVGSESEFTPLTQAELNEPKHQRGLNRVGGEYRSAH